MYSSVTGTQVLHKRLRKHETGKNNGCEKHDHLGGESKGKMGGESKGRGIKRED